MGRKRERERGRKGEGEKKREGEGEKRRKERGRWANLAKEPACRAGGCPWKMLTLKVL